MPEQIEISESRNTWGCTWRELGGEKHYGFAGLPPSAKLWLECVGGNAVRQILASGRGEIVGTVSGAYGGECQTLLVNVAELETLCRAYWDRANVREEQSTSCHYCGQSACGIGFFGEPVCGNCGG